MTGFVDPLDPANLNTPLSPAEQQVIAEAVSMIRAERPEDLATPNAHNYENRPHPDTGAQLPKDGTYKTYYVRSPGARAGTIRIVIGSSGSIYYTNNHYKSFYPVDILGKSDAE